MSILDGAHVLITGGTGSLGVALVERLLSGQHGAPERIVVLSHAEKQADMKVRYSDSRIDYQLGDVRDARRMEEILQGVDIVFNAAALKRVEMCERHPDEAISTNIDGTRNIISAIRRYQMPVHTVVGVSSDKGCQPINVYGATKFLQESLILWGNRVYPRTRFVSVCYGNVMGSSGSMIPFFKDRIATGYNIDVRSREMTRFLISLSEAVDALMAALDSALPGEVYVPMLDAARVIDVAELLVEGSAAKIHITQPGPGEKTHETLITPQEAIKAERRGKYYVVTTKPQERPALLGEYVSSDYVLTKDALRQLFREQGHIEVTE